MKPPKRPLKIVILGGSGHLGRRGTGVPDGLGAPSRAVTWQRFERHGACARRLHGRHGHRRVARWRHRAQDAAAGALPTLYAATASLRGGEYIGPDGLLEMRGAPTVVESMANSHSRESAQKLWEASEELTGVKYDFS